MEATIQDQAKPGKEPLNGKLPRVDVGHGQPAFDNSAITVPISLSKIERKLASYQVTRLNSTNTATLQSADLVLDGKTETAFNITNKEAKELNFANQVTASVQQTKEGGLKLDKCKGIELTLRKPKGFFGVTIEKVGVAAIELSPTDDPSKMELSITAGKKPFFFTKTDTIEKGSPEHLVVKAICDKAFNIASK